MRRRSAGRPVRCHYLQAGQLLRLRQFFVDWPDRTWSAILNRLHDACASRRRLPHRVGPWIGVVPADDLNTQQDSLVGMYAP